MKNRRWGRRVFASLLWTMAMLTWGSIGHHLFGLPDLGPILAATAVGVLFVRPYASRLGTEQSAEPTPASAGPLSRA